MIITKQIDFNAILNLIKNESVFRIGCSECATLFYKSGEKKIIHNLKNIKEPKDLSKSLEMVRNI